MIAREDRARIRVLRTPEEAVELLRCCHKGLCAELHNPLFAEAGSCLNTQLQLMVSERGACVPVGTVGADTCIRIVFCKLSGDVGAP